MYTGRAGGPFTYREGKAQAIRELAAREGIDLPASWAYSDSESDLPMLRAVGHPVAVNPDAELARVAREEGWEVMRFDRLGPPAARRRRRAGARPRSAASARARWRGRAHEPARADERAAGDPRAREADSPTSRWRRTRPRGTASTRSRASCSRALGELGLMGVCVPEEQGGAGADFLSYVLVLEELSRADAGVGVTVAVHTSACTLPLLDHGSEHVACRRAGERRGAGGVRAHRGRLGLRRERDAHALRGRPHHRREAVDHQRLARLHVPRLRPRGRAHQRVRGARRRRGLRASRARRRSWG